MIYIIILIEKIIILFGFKLRIKGRNIKNKIIFKHSEHLVDHHFNLYSTKDHPCINTFKQALGKLNTIPALIVETGSSAWGTNSTILFDNYINNFGGTLETVDVRLEPCINLLNKCSQDTIINIQDSVIFLREWSFKNKDRKIDLLYLDSCDIDWISPNDSMLHCLKEFLVCSQHLQSGSLLLIDDTPINSNIMKKTNPNNLKYFEEFYIKNGFYPGKGSLILSYLNSSHRGKLIEHEYQLLWQF